MCTEACTDSRKVASVAALLRIRQRVRHADSREARQPKSAESLKCTACTPQADEEKSNGRDSIHGATGARAAGANRAECAGQRNRPAQVGPRSARRALWPRARREA